MSESRSVSSIRLSRGATKGNPAMMRFWKVRFIAPAHSSRFEVPPYMSRPVLLFITLHEHRRRIPIQSCIYGSREQSVIIDSFEGSH